MHLVNKCSRTQRHSRSSEKHSLKSGVLICAVFHSCWTHADSKNSKWSQFTKPPSFLLFRLFKLFFLNPLFKMYMSLFPWQHQTLHLASTCSLLFTSVGPANPRKTFHPIGMVCRPCSHKFLSTDGFWPLLDIVLSGFYLISYGAQGFYKATNNNGSVVPNEALTYSKNWKR